MKPIDLSERKIYNENAETQKQSKEELGKAYVGSMHKMINLIDDKTKAKSKDPGYIYSKEN